MSAPKTVPCSVKLRVHLFPKHPSRSVPFRADPCPVELQAADQQNVPRLFKCRCYLRKDYLGCQDTVRMMDPFVSYISLTCCLGLLGRRPPNCKEKRIYIIALLPCFGCLYHSTRVFARGPNESKNIIS